MSDESGLAGAVVSEVSDQVDVDGLLAGDNPATALDGAAAGERALGRIGERLGRAVGESVGEAIHETVTRGAEEGADLGELASDVATAVREGLSEALADDDLDGLRSLVGAAVPSADAAGEGEGEAVEAEAESEGTETETEAEKATEAAPAEADDLTALRSETLEEFLSTVSYRDLQSIAKDVGVKANLNREEMTDRIVETVSDGGSEE